MLRDFHVLLNLFTFTDAKLSGEYVPGVIWAGPQPSQAPLAVPNVTAHPSTASVPTSY